MPSIRVPARRDPHRRGARGRPPPSRLPAWLVVAAAAACTRHGEPAHRADTGAAAPARAAPVDAAPPVAPAPLPARVALHPALLYEETRCALDAEPFRLHLLRLESGAGVEVRALANPTARRDPSCAGRYGGADLPALLAAAPPGFRVLGATNGNFFHEVPGGAFRANGMIASAAPEGLRRLAPVQPTTNPDYRGDRVLVLDAAGGHEITIATGACTPGACRVAVLPPYAPPLAAALGRRAQPMSEREFVAALGEAFPTATLAMQLTPAYAPRPGAPAESVQCVPAHAWTCQPHPVTLLCVAPSARVTLVTAEAARYEALARALGPGGGCGTECTALYLLDGGGSAQIGYADPSDGRFVMRYSGRRDPAPPAGCAAYRPVEHYLVAGVPLAARASD